MDLLWREQAKEDPPHPPPKSAFPAIVGFLLNLAIPGFFKVTFS